ncbi:hypothetical protein pb186bvf_019236 [Paramecium bursaria]
MLQEKGSKIGKKIKELIQNFQKPEEIQFVHEDKKFDPYMDLCEFEYVSMQSVNEQSIQCYTDCIMLLKQEPIDLRKLSNILFKGDELKALRGVNWRLLIGYLMPSRRQWVNLLAKKKDFYVQYINEYIISKQQKQQNDHPLSRDKNSGWNSYFEDAQLWNKIELDTKRTRKQEGFFHQVNERKIYEDDNQARQDKKDSTPAILSKRAVEYNFDVLTRILFIFCKSNTKPYVQGMNEIVAIIYYCFQNDDCELLRQNSEADTYYCFNILMSQMRQNFDNSHLQDRIRSFGDLLQKSDARLYEYLMKQKIDLKFFMMQWLITSFSKEFNLSDTLLIWDAIFRDIDDRNDFVQYFALALLRHMRDELIESEFGEIMMKLQNLDQQKLDVNRIIELAYRLRKEYKK